MEITVLIAKCYLPRGTAKDEKFNQFVMYTYTEYNTITYHQ